MKRFIGVVTAILVMSGVENASARSKKATIPQRVARINQEQVVVEEVLSLSGAQYVVLLRTTALPYRFLPLSVGETEALAIRLRLDHRAPPRPLTLNLLDDVLDSSRIAVVECAIDDIKGGTVLGRVKLRQNARSWNVDARPSDAIGIALGHGAPIWVNKEVLQSSAIDPDQLPTKGAASSAYEETL